MNYIDPNTMWMSQFQNALAALSRPEGMIGLLFLMVLFVLCIFSRHAQLAAVAIMLWTASLSFYVVLGTGYARPVIAPIEQIRLYGRGITTALLIMLVLPSVMASPGWRRKAIAGSALSFFIYEMVFAFIEVLSAEGGGVAGLGRFVLAGMIFALMMIVLGWGLPKWMQSIEDFHRVLAWVGVSAAILCGGTLAQVLVDRSAVEDPGGRLAGTTGKPQHFAVTLAMALLPLCYLVARRNQKVYQRIFFGAVTALAAIFLLWTGSRTGTLMALIGLIIMFRYRMGRALLLGCFAALFVLLFLNLFSDSTVFSEHLLSTQDNRSVIWQMQWNGFLAHPLMGDASGVFGLSENSYLATAARYGILGLIPLVATMCVTLFGMIRLHRLRKNLGENVLAADMVIGSIVSIAVGAWFEAYLLGTLTFMVFFIYIILTMMGTLTEIAIAQPQQAAPPQGFEAVGPEYPQYAHAF